MRQLAKSTARATEKVAEFQITVACFIVVAIVIIMAYGVVMRYVFRQGLAWTLEVPTLSFLVINSLGLAYVQIKRKHLNVDLLTMKLPPRGKSILRAFCCAVFFYFCFVLVQAMATRVAYDWVVKSDTARIPMALLDIILILGLGMLMLQLLVDTGRALVDLSRKV